MRRWASAGLLVAGLMVLAAAWLLPPTRNHPVTPAMLASAGGMAGSRLPGMTLEASDGRPIDLGAIAADRPAVLVFLQDGCPCSEAAEPYFQRLHDAYGAGVAFLGVIDGDRPVARGWAERHRSPYPVLADPDLRIIRACKAERSAYVALVAPGGTIERLWPGYSAGMLADLGHRLSELSGLAEAPVDTSGAPAGLASGCSF